MFIKSAFEIRFELACPTPMIAMLHLHPSLAAKLRAGDELLIEHEAAAGVAGFPRRVQASEYSDSFGNRCSRFVAPAGLVRLSGMSVVEMEEAADPAPTNAEQHPVQELPHEVLQFLLSSRYCEVDRFVAVANDLFSGFPAGGARALAIRDWVHQKVNFNYMAARSTKTAMDVFTERMGVCRDFQHLAITLSRCMNIPARYVTGYLGDIRHPYSGPGDFSAWWSELQAIMAPWSSSNHRPHCGSGCSRGRGRFRTAWRLIQRLFIGITSRPDRRRLAVACQWDQRLPSPRGVGPEQIRRDAFSIFVEHQEGAMIWIKPEVALRTLW